MPWGLLLPRCSSHMWNGVLAKISIATVALSAPKKHSQAHSSSDELCWQNSKDAALQKMSSFSRLELFGPE